ncbi:MAG: hypothetical protein M1838_000731 [Thelocarpon superellum]|nr:MAG: hypothetical protein M1838_000731 [Thelocarpon superellum]
MLVQVTKFTPEVLLSTPRRSNPIAHPDGNLLLYTVSIYSFESHSQTSEVRVYNIAARHSELLLSDVKASDPNWLGYGTRIIWLQSEGDGSTRLMTGDLGTPSSTHYEVHRFNGPVSNLKVRRLEHGTIAVAVTGQITPRGLLLNPKRRWTSHSTGKVYDSLFVRHWDSYVTRYKSTIWYGALKMTFVNNNLASDGLRCSLASRGFSNAIADRELESPIPPFGGTDHFDIGPRGIVFIAKDPSVNQALHTTSSAYFVPLHSFTERPAPRPQIIPTDGLCGASTSPAFSPLGASITFLRMMDPKYESDLNHVVMVPDVECLSRVQVQRIRDVSAEGLPNLSPSSVTWSHGGTLLLTVEYHGRVRLFMAPTDFACAGFKFEPVESLPGSISSVQPLSTRTSELLISSTSFLDNSRWSIYDPTSTAREWTVSSNTMHGKLLGLHPGQVSHLWFRGADDRRVHAWVMVPSEFDPRNRYPLAYLVHGGPQGAWTDSWSTRWNPAIFAEQGYVVVMPNPTGSTGYGQDFVDAIQDQWGGRPYEDLVAGFASITDTMPYVDTTRAVALGASYGGYMMNWIQGQELGREFQALVTHDGVFSTTSAWSTEELYFPVHEFKGTLWENRASYERWDPARFTGNWSTPHLVIHNDLDFRLPLSEGLAAFNVLQARGVKSRFLRFGDENHWVLKPENSKLWHEVVLDWINEAVGLPRLTNGD